jgi:hypothetical protein
LIRIPAPALAALSCCWACIVLVATGWAGEARVVETGGSDRLVIEAEDANLDDILQLLAARFEFDVERHTTPSGTIRFSGRLEGSLDQLLERLLRHEGHIIVRSPEALARVSRVVLVGADTGARPPAPVVRDSFANLSKGFPQRAKLQLPQLWAGTP